MSTVAGVVSTAAADVRRTGAPPPCGIPRYAGTGAAAARRHDHDNKHNKHNNHSENWKETPP